MSQVSIVQSSMDIEQCLDIRRSVFCGILNMPSESVFDAHDSDAIHALATLGHKPIASGRVARREGQWWIELVSVLPRHRKSGIGRQVVRALINEAAKRNIGELKVQANEMDDAFLKTLDFQNGAIPVKLEKK